MFDNIKKNGVVGIIEAQRWLMPYPIKINVYYTKLIKHDTWVSTIKFIKSLNEVIY